MTTNENEQLTAKLPIHDAFTEGVIIPRALLLHYRDLGLNAGLLVYVLQIINDYKAGREIKLATIARRMGCSQRSLSRYNAQLRALGLINIEERFDKANRQLESRYDLTPLIDQAWLQWNTTRQHESQLARLNELVDRIARAVATGQDVSGLLDKLFELRKGIGSYDPMGVTELSSPPDPRIPPPTLTELSPSPDDNSVTLPPRQNDQGGSRGRPPRQNDHPLTTTKDSRSIFSVKDLPVVVAKLLNGNEQLQAVYDWAVTAGVAGFSSKMIEILEMDPDPETVRAHALDRLAAVAHGDHSYGPGLFIHKILTGEPAPPARCETCLQLEGGCICDLDDQDAWAKRHGIPPEYRDIIQH